eukprot:12813874-Alexandrium_andersonii.AAC.1
MNPLRLTAFILELICGYSRCDIRPSMLTVRLPGSLRRPSADRAALQSNHNLRNRSASSRPARRPSPKRSQMPEADRCCATPERSSRMRSR